MRATAAIWLSLAEKVPEELFLHSPRIGPTMDMQLEDRLTELEVRLAFLDETVQILNGTVAAHDRNLIALRTELERFRVELGAVRVALAHDARTEPPPPHY